MGELIVAFLVAGWVVRNLFKLKRKVETMAQELVNLQTNIAALTKAVDAVVAQAANAIAPADVQTAADQVSTQTSRLTALVPTPVVPPPTPTG